MIDRWIKWEISFFESKKAVWGTEDRCTDKQGKSEPKRAKLTGCDPWRTPQCPGSWTRHWRDKEQSLSCTVSQKSRARDQISRSLGRIYVFTFWIRSLIINLYAFYSYRVPCRMILVPELENRGDKIEPRHIDPDPKDTICQLTLLFYTFDFCITAATLHTKINKTFMVWSSGQNYYVRITCSIQWSKFDSSLYLIILFHLFLFHSLLCSFNSIYNATTFIEEEN